MSTQLLTATDRMSGCVGLTSFESLLGSSEVDDDDELVTVHLSVLLSFLALHMTYYCSIYHGSWILIFCV